MNKPIKRDLSIQPLSRDHHHGLLLCWKIRTGFSKNVSTERIKSYTDWFYKNHIMKHFEIEEKYVFSVLGKDNELVKQALNEHKVIKKLFTQSNESDIEKSLKQLSDELEKHIRFEERILFNEIQLEATSEQLESILKHHPDEKFCENQIDEFWK